MLPECFCDVAAHGSRLREPGLAFHPDARSAPLCVSSSSGTLVEGFSHGAPVWLARRTTRKGVVCFSVSCPFTDLEVTDRCL